MKTFKVGDTVPFRVRCNGDPATDNPTAQVFDETDTPEGVALTLGAGLVQVPGTKIVVGSFVPDAEGQWSVNIVDDTGMDRVKEFIIRGFSIESIGNDVNSIESKVDAQDLVLATIIANTEGGGGHFG